MKIFFVLYNNSAFPRDKNKNMMGAFVIVQSQ